MELVCQTEYQDVYRVKNGVLLVINKFKDIVDKNGRRDFISSYSKNRPYHKHSKDLRVLTADYYYSPTHKTYKAGQVIYCGCHVELIDNKEEWVFQIKTTGDALSGTFNEIASLIMNIYGKVCEANERIVCSN
ncbi:MAG: hypothetical protein IKW51_08480 [Bacteroidales bacterium]|nr:hypothetical protein [Bacteroidales bacterium]